MTTTLRLRVAALEPEAEALGTTTGEEEGEAATEGAPRRGTIGAAAAAAVPAWAAGAAAIRAVEAAALGAAVEGPTAGREEDRVEAVDRARYREEDRAVAVDRARSRGRQSSAAEAGCRDILVRPSAGWGVRAGSAGRPAGTLTARGAVAVEAADPRGSMLTRTL